MKKLGEIATVVEGELHGDPECPVIGISGINDAVEGEITFLESRRYLKYLRKTKASAVIIPSGIDAPPNINVIVHPKPSEAFIRVVDFLSPPSANVSRRIHEHAVLEKTASVGRGCSIDAYCVIGSSSAVGNNCVLSAFVYIGANVKIGDNCLIYPNVTIHRECVIGNNAIIHSGTVIGGDGFGYITTGGKHIKIPQRGNVVIEDDVEIGSSVTIDRARIGSTIIGKGTKIDNLVMVAHNVRIGKNCIIVAQTGISGSTHIGDNVIVGGQAGFAGHLKIGDNSRIAARSGVIKDVPEGSVISGFPAGDHIQQLKLLSYFRKLPRLFKHFDNIERSPDKQG